MRHVVLDTNCVGFEPPLGGNSQRLLIDAAARGQLVLVVPELVVRETMNIWSERATERLEKLQAVANDLAGQGLRVGVPSEEDLEARRSEVEAELRATLSGPNILCPDLPTVAHDEVVQRALDRRLPFDSGGKDGYRDALLWETVLELVEDHDVMLVSADRRAFAGDDHESLAFALMVDVYARSDRDDPIALFTSASRAAQHFASEDDSAGQRVEQLLGYRSFRTVFREQLEDAIEFQDLDPQEADKLIPEIPIDLASITELIQLGRVDLRRAYAIADDIGLVELTVLCDVGVSFFAPLTQVESLKRRGSLSLSRERNNLSTLLGTEIHPTRHYAAISVEAAIRLKPGAIDRLEMTDAHLVDEAQYAPEPPALDPEDEDEEANRG